MSIKIDMMVQDVINNNKDYKIMPAKLIKSYIRKKYKCSIYMANQVIKKLSEE